MRSDKRVGISRNQACCYSVRRKIKNGDCSSYVQKVCGAAVQSYNGAHVVRRILRVNGVQSRGIQCGCDRVGSRIDNCNSACLRDDIGLGSVWKKGNVSGVSWNRNVGNEGLCLGVNDCDLVAVRACRPCLAAIRSHSDAVCKSWRWCKTGHCLCSRVDDNYLVFDVCYKQQWSCCVCGLVDSEGR